MKKFMAALIGTAFIVSTIGLAVAQTTTTTPAPADKKTEKMEKAGDKMEKKTEKKMAAKSTNGVVKSASPDSIVVSGKDKGGKDAEWTFAVDSKTKIKKGGKDATAADLKAGDSVSVRYMDHEGKTVATAVNAKAGGTAKKDEAATKKDDMKKPATDGAAKPAEKK